MSAGQERGEGAGPLAPSMREAVAAAYVALSDRLLAYIRTRVPDQETAEDLLEQTFLQLIQRAPALRGGTHTAEVYLFRVATNVVVDHLRRAARRPEELVGDFRALDGPDLDDDPHEVAAVADTTDQVRRALQQLSPDQRTVLQLRYAGGLSAPEIARVMGKNETAIRSLQHRGERSLARLLLRSSDYETPLPRHQPQRSADLPPPRRGTEPR